MIVIILVATFCYLIPAVLTICNIVYLFKKQPINENFVDWAIFIIGIPLSKIMFDLLPHRDFNESIMLFNEKFHMPIASWHLPTLIVLFIVAIIGYSILRIKKNKLPPAIIICCISTIYIGTILGIFFVIQLSKNFFTVPVQTVPFDIIYMTLFPINYMLCSIRLLRQVISLQTKRIKENKTEYKNAFMKYCSKLLSNSLGWYTIPFIVAIPILAILLIILVLFGQAPDAIIRAFTETSDWTLSQKISPPPIEYEGHYLCTVAVNGHKSLVKPTRCGIRHGEKIIVNRQLCIANAFEQLIQEKTPYFHKFIRFIYDKYGYPLSKHITTANRADVIYILMKPLEWIFLFVLYFLDVSPENRISMQYIGNKKPS